MVWLGQKRLAVALGHLPGIDELDHLVGQVKETDRVGEVGAAASQALGKRTGGDVEVAEQDCYRRGLLTGGARYSNGAECASFANLRARVRSPGLRAWEGVELGGALGLATVVAEPSA